MARWMFALLLATLLTLTFANGGVRAQDTTAAQCSAALEANRERLRSLIADLQREGLSQEMANRIVEWSRAFRTDVAKLSQGDRIEGMAVGTGGSVLASVALGGPPGWGAAALGAVIGLLYVDAKNAIQSVANWAAVDQNTVFYQFLIDYLEYGRLGDPKDKALQRFVSTYGGLLGQLTGSAPPADPAALSRYLQAHADSLLLYFGHFEETAGAAAFPRWRFPQTQGRFGHDRLAVGYYRKVLVERLVQQMRHLDRELALLQARGCTGDPAAQPVTLESCAVPPGPGESKVCRCDTPGLGTVWGSDLYTNDSNICAAATHRGLVWPQQKADGSIAYIGLVEITGAAGCPYYHGTTGKGVASRSFGYWPGSFYFPESQAGLCDERSRPPSGLWYCPIRLGTEQRDLTCFCTPYAVELGPIWGTGIYTDDSSLCRAAAHAGRIGPNGGTVRVLAVGGLDQYEASERGGIQSSGFGPWPRSIGFP